MKKRHKELTLKQNHLHIFDSSNHPSSFLRQFDYHPSIRLKKF